MSNDPLVSVIVTTKNEKLHIENCLSSILTQAYKDIEIIVVDNSSEDGTKEIARKFTKNVLNMGPERSVQRNFGAKKAKGKFIVFIDADMILTRDVIKEAVNRFKDEEIGAVVIPEKSIGEGYWTKVKAFERSLYERDSSIEAARFFKSSIFWEVGGYDTNITGPEDWDLPQRVKKKYKIDRVKSYILHDEGKISLSSLAKKKYYYGLKGSRYILKHRDVRVTQQAIYFLRPAFYKNWKKLILNPRMFLGMIIMLTLEQFFGALGVLKGSLINIQSENRKRIIEKSA